MSWNCLKVVSQKFAFLAFFDMPYIPASKFFSNLGVFILKKNYVKRRDILINEFYGCNNLNQM